jgi:hypothetical protein
MKWSALVCVGLLTLAACGGEKSGTAKNPDKPAVVVAPPIVLPSDTARPDTTAETQQKLDKAGRELNAEYALLGAAAVFGDLPTVATFYANDATLWLGDSTYVGKTRISTALATFMKRASVKEIVRRSVKMTVSDSVYADSGIYGMLSQRPGGNRVDERGTFVTEWVFGGSPKRWTIRKDDIRKPAPQKSR